MGRLGQLEGESYQGIEEEAPLPLPLPAHPSPWPFPWQAGEFNNANTGYLSLADLGGSVFRKGTPTRLLEHAVFNWVSNFNVSQLEDRDTMRRARSDHLAEAST